MLKAKPDTPFGRPFGNRGGDDTPVPGGREVVLGPPARRIVLDAVIDEARLERLEHRVRVAEVVDTDRIEIVEAPGDRQVATPVIRIAVEDEPLARINLGHPVGP